MRHLVNQLYSYPFEMHTAIVIQQKSDSVKKIKFQMKKFILCMVGFPASGKSTFARKLHEKLKFNLFHLGKNISFKPKLKNCKL